MIIIVRLVNSKYNSFITEFYIIYSYTIHKYLRGHLRLYCVCKPNVYTCTAKEGNCLSVSLHDMRDLAKYGHWGNSKVMERIPILMCWINLISAADETQWFFLYILNSPQSSSSQLWGLYFHSFLSHVADRFITTVKTKEKERRISGASNEAANKRR